MPAPFHTPFLPAAKPSGPRAVYVAVEVVVFVWGASLSRKQGRFAVLPTRNFLWDVIHQYLLVFYEDQSLAKLCHSCFPLIVFFGVGSIAPLPNPIPPQVFEQSLLLFLEHFVGMGKGDVAGGEGRERERESKDFLLPLSKENEGARESKEGPTSPRPSPECSR